MAVQEALHRIVVIDDDPDVAALLALLFEVDDRFDLVQVLWTHSMWRDYDDHLSRLIEGYELIRPLHHDERRHLPLFQTLPLVDWINRTLRANDRDALKRWLPPTMKCLRRLAARGP